MLGITPTILALLGASSEEVCLLALVGKRRLLALLPAAASPSIYTKRAFEYRNPRKILEDGLDREHVDFSLQLRYRKLFILLEYTFAFAALANIGTLSWDIGIRTVNGVNPNHIAGAVIFNLRARRVDRWDEPRPDDGKFELTSLSNLQPVLKWTFSSSAANLIRNPWSSFRALGINWWSTMLREFWLHPAQGPDERLYKQLFKETRLFIMAAWFLSVLIVFHLILGTLILSSTTLIGPRDALGVMARYILSAVTCRVILVYELAVIRSFCRNGREARRREKNQNDTRAVENKNEGRKDSTLQVISAEKGSSEISATEHV